VSAVRVRSLLATLLGALITCAGLAVPAYAYVQFSTDDGVADRYGAASPTHTPEQLEALVGPVPDLDAPQPPLVLSYHNVAPDPTPEARYTVTPEQLADHLAMLRTAGYESIDVAQLTAWLDGEGELPDRSVMLTFDDGAKGLWQYADSILEEQGFDGVVFVITDRVGTRQPYYLTWPEIDRMADSGRWNIESHTKSGHDRIPVDGDGNRAPFLINPAWLPEEGRIETHEEFERRIRRDLLGSIVDLAPYADGRDGRVFSYPFSAQTFSLSDPQAPFITAEAVGQIFDAAMTNVLPDRLVSERDRRARVLPRIEVFAATSTQDLFTRVSQAIPTSPGPASPLAHPVDWTDSSGEALAGVSTGDVDQGSELADQAEFDPATGSLDLRAGPGQYLAALHSPGRSADWVDYRVTANVGDLGSRAGGPTGSVFALLESDEQVQVAVSATHARVLLGSNPTTRRVIAEQPMRSADSRLVTVDVTADELSVVVDGVELARTALPGFSTGGVALAATGGPVSFSSMHLETADRGPALTHPIQRFETTSGDWRAEGDLAVTDSPVFRARTLTAHDDVTVDLRFRVDHFVPGDEDHEWDGVHVGVRYASPDDLYYVSVGRRDGVIAIKRKSGGVYETLAQRQLPFDLGRWHQASVTVTTGPAGVSIGLSVDGQGALSVLDATAPLTAPGRVSIRSDNASVAFSDVEVRDL
jgi:hypothetical protein